MRSRQLVTAAAALALASVASTPTPGQTAAQDEPDRSWTAPRAGDGRPDLQGVWLSNNATPLQRPPAFADRADLTEEEVARLRDRAQRIFENGRSAFAIPESAFFAALNDVETYEALRNSSSIGMVDLEFSGRTSLVVDPPDGRIPNLTAEARARVAAVDVGWDQKTGPEDLNNFHRCVTTGVPRLGGNFGSGPYTFYQLIQTPNYVVIVMEAFHDARIIPIAQIAPIDARPRLPDRIRQWNGDSRGHWEGDTLVVKTGNFSADSYFRGATANLELVERFTRTADDTLTYELTFTDPTTWATSWTAETLLSRREEAIYEFACHEGNRSLVGMLRTARLLEQR